MLQGVGQIGRDGELNLFDVVGDPGDEIAGGVLVEEMGRLIDDIFVSRRSQAGHAGLAHVVQNIGRAVFGRSLGQSRQYSQQSNYQPGSLKGKEIDLFQVDFLGNDGQLAERYAAWWVGNENVIQHQFDQDGLEALEARCQTHQQGGGRDEWKKGLDMAEERPLFHSGWSRALRLPGRANLATFAMNVKDLCRLRILETVG